MNIHINTSSLHDAAQLRQAIMALVRRLRQHSEGGDLPVAQMFLLSRIERLGEGTTPSELAVQEGLRLPNLSALLTTLENQGYVVRYQTPEDKRRIIVRLTPQGRAILIEDRNRRERWLASAIDSCLSEKELQLLKQSGQLLQRLAQWDGQAKT